MLQTRWYKSANAVVVPDPTSEIPRFQNKHFVIPRNPAAAFTQRDRIYKPLQEACLPLANPDVPQQTRFVLCGLGGSGKTQLCLKFAEEYREKCVASISEVRAD